MGNLCFGSGQSDTDKKARRRKLSINVLYNKQKVLKIKKLALKKKKWTDDDIVKVLDKTEKDLQKRGVTEAIEGKPYQRKLFRQKARLLINYLTVVQQRHNAVTPEAVKEEDKKRKTFKKHVNHLINVMKMTTANRIQPSDRLDEDDVEVVLASKLAYFMDKWKDDERVVFETEEEAVIAQNILEEMLGRELGYDLRKGDYMFNNFTLSRVPRVATPAPGPGEADSRVVMVHTQDTQPPGAAAEEENSRWRVRRRSTQQSLDLRADVARARARLGRTNSIYAGADTDTEDGECGDSCGSETEQEDTELEEEEEVGVERRHSLPSLHPMADLEMVKFVIRPNSSITRDHQKPRSQQLGYDSSKPRDIPTIVVTVPHDEERGPSNGWEAGYKHFLFRLNDDIEQKEAKLQRMYERPLRPVTASATMQSSDSQPRKKKKSVLDKVNRSRTRQKRKAGKLKRRREAIRNKL